MTTHTNGPSQTGTPSAGHAPHSVRAGRWVAALAGLVLGLYLALAPGGLLSAADMVGYAVCHRIPSHSFHIAGRQLPLCARCSGTFLGALTGLVGQAVVLKRRRESGFPPVPIMILLVLFIILMGADGLNSYLTMVLNRPLLYEPQQWLRLVTGSLNGLALSSLLWPVVNLSLWATPSPQPAIRGWRDLGVLLALEAGMTGLVFSRWAPLLYPLALLSAAGVVAMLTLVHVALILILTGWENRYHRLRDAAVPLMLGFIVAMIEIGLIDLFRYAVTGTVEGIPGLS